MAITKHPSKMNTYWVDGLTIKDFNSRDTRSGDSIIEVLVAPAQPDLEALASYGVSLEGTFKDESFEGAFVEAMFLTQKPCRFDASITERAAALSRLKRVGATQTDEEGLANMVGKTCRATVTVVFSSETGIRKAYARIDATDFRPGGSSESTFTKSDDW